MDAVPEAWQPQGAVDRRGGRHRRGGRAGLDRGPVHVVERPGAEAAGEQR